MTRGIAIAVTVTVTVAVVLVFSLALLGACAPPPREPEPLAIEEVEVGDPVDAGLSTEGDEKGTRPAASDDWILTGMLPDDLPLHRPARLVDSTDRADGRRTFVFQTTTPPEEVRAGLVRRLRESGWVATTSAAGLTAAKGGESVDFVFAELRPGTEIEVVY